MKVQIMDKVDGIGNSFGYATHQRNLYNAMQQLGVEFADDADIALHVKPLLHYEAVPDKTNVVYTMYEYTTLPPNWIKALETIDLIIVPCKQNRELFGRYTDRPIEVCLEGVDTGAFRYTERQFPVDRPFRFYWFGVNNPRKGWPVVIKAWEAWNNIFPWLKDKTELYLKACNGLEEQVIHEENIYHDNRTLGLSELENLNHIAHCYLFPTMGEGFGLTLAEAASTGLPCLYTNWSGPVDYMDGRGFPLDYQLVDVTTNENKPGWERKIQHKTQAAWVTLQSIVGQMHYVYTHYSEALRVGKRAADWIANNLTWARSAETLVDILERWCR